MNQTTEQRSGSPFQVGSKIQVSPWYLVGFKELMIKHPLSIAAVNTLATDIAMHYLPSNNFNNLIFI